MDLGWGVGLMDRKTEEVDRHLDRGTGRQRGLTQGSGTQWDGMDDRMTAERRDQR